MAQLNDTLVQGDLRVTGTIYGTGTTSIQRSGYAYYTGATTGSMIIAEISPPTSNYSDVIASFDVFNCPASNGGYAFRGVLSVGLRRGADASTYEKHVGYLGYNLDVAINAYFDSTTNKLLICANKSGSAYVSVKLVLKSATNYDAAINTESFVTMYNKRSTDSVSSYTEVSVNSMFIPKGSGTVALQDGTYSSMTVGNAATATTATTATRLTNNGSATANAARYVWFSDNSDEARRVYDTNFKYNPSGNLLTTNITGTSGSVGSLLYAFRPGAYSYGYTHLFTVDYGTVKKGMCTFRVNASRGISVVVAINAAISRTDGGATKAWMAVEGETEAITGYFKLSYKAASDSTTDRPKYEVWLIDTGSSASAERRVGVEVVNTNIAIITPGNNSTTTLPDGLVDFTYASIKEVHTHSVKINGATKTIEPSGGTAVDLDYHPTARAVSATTVKNAIQELRVLPGGSVGSVNLAADNSVENVKIPAGWYNYIWTPHRAGASGGDHQNYGSLILMSMTHTSPQTFVVEGTKLADASPVYRCRLLSQVSAAGSAYFANNAKYRKIGTLSGPSETADTCATFLVCVNIANVTKQSGILNVDIRNNGGTYVFNVTLTELTGSASWTSKLKLFKNGGNLYLYGFGASQAWYSVEVTPLSVTDLTGTQVPGMWVPDTSNTDESSVSYTAITYGISSYALQGGDYRTQGLKASYSTTSGTADTAKTVSNVSSLNTTNIEIDPTNGVKVGSTNNPLTTKLTSGGFESRSSVSGTIKTTAINSDGVTVSSGSDSVSMSSSGFTGPLTGNVTGNVNGSAARLANTSKVGGTDKPVYFTANGVPAVCTSIALNVTGNLTGNADTASALVIPTQLGNDNRPVYFTAQGTPAMCGSRFLYGCDSSGAAITTQYRVCIGSVCSANNSISIV